jgi:hypothetical protein
MEELKSALGDEFAKCFDFMAFFHQFPIEPTCGVYFAIRIGDRFYAPTTIPTGAMQPPLFAQLLMNAICVALANSGCKAGGFIDNIRLTSNSMEKLDSTTGVMMHLLRRLKITLNEGCETSPRYTYLGVTYDHERSTVSVSDKTIEKLRLAAPTSRQVSATRSAILSLFGRCVWASTVLGVPRAAMY